MSCQKFIGICVPFVVAVVVVLRLCLLRLWSLVCRLISRNRQRRLLRTLCDRFFCCLLLLFPLLLLLCGGGGGKTIKRHEAFAIRFIWLDCWQLTVWLRSDKGGNCTVFTFCLIANWLTYANGQLEMFLQISPSLSLSHSTLDTRPPPTTMVDGCDELQLWQKALPCTLSTRLRAPSLAPLTSDSAGADLFSKID